MTGPLVICSHWLFPVWAIRKDAGRMINQTPNSIVSEIVSVIFIGHLSTTDFDKQFERKFVP